jgi:hypothetical protein
LDHDEIIQVFDQAKTKNSEWHKAMVNANIDIFEMCYEEFVLLFKHLENLENIRFTNGQATGYTTSRSYKICYQYCRQVF